MIYYMIRHKSTGEFMPELSRGRGYSHWNPGEVVTTEVFNKHKLTGSPRLICSLRKAHGVVNKWFSHQNETVRQYQSYSGEWDEDFKSKPDNRKKEDIEIVIIDIVETGVVTA